MDFSGRSAGDAGSGRLSAAAHPGVWRAASQAPGAPPDAEWIEIEYWQYDYGANVTAMDILIDQFHEAHPHIRILHNFDTSLEDFQTVMDARIPAGLGPDVVSLYHGWQTAWIDAGYLTPLPTDYFPLAEIRAQFSPIIEASVRDGLLYTLPTAVRTGALYYNRDLMAKAGLDPDSPPRTVAELEEQGAQCTQRNEDGTYEILGFPITMTGQADAWFREVLLRQYGQQPYAEDGITIRWNSEAAGYAAWDQFLKFQTELDTGDPTDFDSDPNYFVAGRACFHIDTSFRLETIAANAPDLNFGVVELPTHNDIQSTFGAYWAHGITQKGASSPERLEAAATFLQFITRPEAGLLWIDIVGELPAQPAALEDSPLRNDPMLSAFIAGLDYAHAPIYVDEIAERAALRAAYNAVVLEGMDPAMALDAAVTTIQALRAAE
ncbi:MAG: extracellular solute-binding protein [Litorilinea sp.]